MRHGDFDLDSPAVRLVRALALPACALVYLVSGLLLNRVPGTPPGYPSPADLEVLLVVWRLAYWSVAALALSAWLSDSALLRAAVLAAATGSIVAFTLGALVSGNYQTVLIVAYLGMAQHVYLHDAPAVRWRRR